MGQGDGDGKDWDPVHEIRGAIDWINNPAVRGIEVSLDAFLALESVGWEMSADRGVEETLRSAIDFGDEVNGAAFGLDSRGVAHPCCQQLARVVGSLSGNVQALGEGQA